MVTVKVLSPSIIQRPAPFLVNTRPPAGATAGSSQAASIGANLTAEWLWNGGWAAIAEAVEAGAALSATPLTTSTTATTIGADDDGGGGGGGEGGDAAAPSSGSGGSTRWAATNTSAQAIAAWMQAGGGVGVQPSSATPLMRINGAEPLALLADLWLVAGDDVFDVRGHATPLSVDAMYLPVDYAAQLSTGSGFEKGVLPRRVSLEGVAAARAAPLSAVGTGGVGGAAAGVAVRQPVGVVIALTTLTWRLTGLPLSGWIYDGAGTHVFTLNSSGAVLTVPAGTLRPGYVYSAVVRRVRGGAVWALDDGILVSAATAFTGIRSAGVGALAAAALSSNNNATTAPLPPPTLPLGNTSSSSVLDSFGPPSASLHSVWWPLTTPEFVATPGYGALLYVRVPPSGGGLNSAPVNGGIALATPFNITAGGWVDEWTSVYAEGGAASELRVGERDVGSYNDVRCGVGGVWCAFCILSAPSLCPI